jgi:CopG family nickel-responsive transcriptional regulator
MPAKREFFRLDPHDCLEVLVLRGQGREMKRMGDGLASTRGVKYGNVIPATGEGLE